MKKFSLKTVSIPVTLLVSIGSSQAVLASQSVEIEQPIPVGPEITFNIKSSAGSVNLPFEVDKNFVLKPLSLNENGSYSSDGRFTVNPLGFDVIYEFEYRSNPYIFSNITVTNFSSSDNTFSLSALIPTGSFATVTKGGSIGYTLTDENNDGTATLSGSPTYKAFVDGTQELTLLGISDTCSGVGCTSTFSSKDGVASLVTSSTSKPVATSLAYTNGITSNMGIDLDFTLSAGDKVTFESYFQVTPVPVPAAGWFMLTGLGFLVARKRNSISA